MKPNQVARLTWVLGPLLMLISCTGSSDRPDAAQAEVIVIREARAAIDIAGKALAKTGAVADASWFACMPEMSWSYRGGGTFIAGHGDIAARLATVRSALIQSGFADVTQVEGKVAVERSGVTFVIEPRRIGVTPERWSFSYQSQCRGYSGDDRARIKRGERRDILKDG